MQIVDWTVACVPSNDFTKKTGEVGSIKVTKFNHRPQKSELEIVYEVSDAPVAASTSGDKPATTAASAAAPSLILPRSDFDNVEYVSKKLEALYLDAFTKGNGKVEGADLESLRNQVNHLLATFKNSAYATGFAAKITK